DRLRPAAAEATCPSFTRDQVQAGGLGRDEGAAKHFEQIVHPLELPQLPVERPVRHAIAKPLDLPHSQSRLAATRRQTRSRIELDVIAVAEEIRLEAIRKLPEEGSLVRHADHEQAILGKNPARLAQRLQIIGNMFEDVIEENQ